MSIIDRLRPDAAGRATNRGNRPIGRAVSRPPRPFRSRPGGLRPRDLRRGATAEARAAEATGAVMAGLTGLWTGVLSWLALALPVLLAWAASAQTTATWGSAVRVASDGWLLLHRVGVDVPGGRLAFVPLGLAVLPLGLCWVAGRRIGAGLSRPDAVGRPGLGGPDAVGGPGLGRSLAVPLTSFATGYAAVVLLAAVLARGQGVRPVLWQAVVLGVLVPLLGAVPAALRAVGVPVPGALADLLHLPDRLRRSALAASLAVAGLVAVGAVLLAVSLVVHRDQVVIMHRALDPGVVGGAVLTIAQVGLVPNLALWGVAFVAGPGFAVGAGTIVTPGVSQLGLLPLVPVLGAVPPPGPLPLALPALLLVPLLAGAAAGWFVAARVRPSSEPMLDVVCDALAAAALAALMLTALLALSGGSAGPGTLSAVGPSAWKVGLALAGELAAGAAFGAWATHRRRAG